MRAPKTTFVVSDSYESYSVESVMGTVAMLLVLSSAPTTAVFQATDLDVTDSTNLATATSSATGLRLVTPQGLRATLEERAAALGPTPAQRVDADLQRARDAYLGLRLDASSRIYEEALSSLIDNRRSPAPAELVARIFFERGVVELAGRKRREGNKALLSAVRIDPGLRASPDRYGPPVIRALERAKKAAAVEKAYDIRVDRAPADAIVLIDGREVQSPTVRLRGRGPHLLTAERTGFAPVSRLFEVEVGGEVAVVLERADVALTAEQTLVRWDLIEAARAAGVASVIEAKRIGEDVELTLRDARTQEVKRSVRGRTEEWEPHPWAVLAAALDGRTITRGELALTLSAPSVVPPEGTVDIAVRVVDENKRLAALEARCGQVSARRNLIEPGNQYVLSLPVPEESTSMTCFVTGIDHRGSVIVRAPAPETPLTVDIVAVDETAWYGRWYFWAAVGVAAAAGTTAAIVATRDEPAAVQMVNVRVQP